ncbi:hypothetical protein GGS23DRAFT_570690 [Durotheca rogersii]|uniref:uncharacterized protein n=1 Tax=Durotheca rogersii TaxID=419775 RepID=UPI00221EB34C|nr:uncharacterized protein GGS23DRAFT_570690 [Durotheca rogersii]KAI5862543.1 hypothetical protein GGS23DRAFT_570690 [Durotheca rogersii]
MSDAKDVHSPLLTPGSRVSVPQLGSPSVPRPPKPPASAQNHAQTNPTPIDPMPLKADTNMSWGEPAGLAIRGPNDENLVIFRKALGINYNRAGADSGTLEEGRKSAVGIYKSVLDSQRKKSLHHALLNVFLFLCYFVQIVIGAALTAMGPTSGRYEIVITVMGALNTVLAGTLALIKGSGQPERLEKDCIGFRRLKDWIEETEALLAVGVIGRNRKEVGLLVESAFKRYNAAMMNVENNSPDYYVNQSSDDDDDAGASRRKPGSR